MTDSPEPSKTTTIGAFATAKRFTLLAMFTPKPSKDSGLWSKNGIKGVYHSVGRHYLQTYLNEYSFRYNRRFDTQPMFTSVLRQIEKRDAVVRRDPVMVEPF
jgi:hypothetical protein